MQVEECIEKLPQREVRRKDSARRRRRCTKYGSTESQGLALSSQVTNSPAPVKLQLPQEPIRHKANKRSFSEPKLPGHTFGMKLLAEKQGNI